MIKRILFISTLLFFSSFSYAASKYLGSASSGYFYTGISCPVGSNVSAVSITYNGRIYTRKVTGTNADLYYVCATPLPGEDPPDDTDTGTGTGDNDGASYPLDDSKCQAGRIISSYYDGRAGFPESCVSVGGAHCWSKRHAWGLGVGYKVNYKLTGAACYRDGTGGNAESSFPSDQDIIPLGDLGTPEYDDPFIPTDASGNTLDITDLGDIDPNSGSGVNTFIPDSNGSSGSGTANADGFGTGSGTSSGRKKSGGNSDDDPDSGEPDAEADVCDSEQYVCASQFENAMNALYEQQGEMFDYEKLKDEVNEANLVSGEGFLDSDIKFAEGLATTGDDKLFELQKIQISEGQDIIESHVESHSGFFESVFNIIIPEMLPLDGSCAPLYFTTTSDGSVVEYTCADAAPIRQILGWLFVIYTMLHIYYIVYNNGRDRT
ncbi:MAG: hypothetical protein ACKVJE_22850 [Pseudomonadales bacterium]